MTTSAAELAYHAARIAFAGDALRPGLAIRLHGSGQVELADVVAALDKAPKPLRVTGRAEPSALELQLGPVDPDPETAMKYRTGRFNSRGIENLPGCVDPQASDDTSILVIAFDELLYVSMAIWREFITDYWVDGPFASSANQASSEWARQLDLPPSVVRQAAAFVHFGYSVGNGFCCPSLPEAWGSGLTSA